MSRGSRERSPIAVAAQCVQPGARRGRSVTRTQSATVRGSHPINAGLRASAERCRAVTAEARSITGNRDSGIAEAARARRSGLSANRRVGLSRDPWRGPHRHRDRDRGLASHLGGQVQERPLFGPDGSYRPLNEWSHKDCALTLRITLRQQPAARRLDHANPRAARCQTVARHGRRRRTPPGGVEGGA